MMMKPNPTIGIMRRHAKQRGFQKQAEKVKNLEKQEGIENEKRNEIKRHKKKCSRYNIVYREWIMKERMKNK